MGSQTAIYVYCMVLLKHLRSGREVGVVETSLRKLIVQFSFVGTVGPDY